MSTTVPTVPPSYSAASVPGDAPSAGGQGRLFAVLFGALAAIVTLGAILLAVIAPALSSAPPAPGNWTKVVDANLANNSSLVSSGEGCALTSKGLDVTGGQNVHTACDITAGSSDPLVNGFLLTATLAPNGQLSGAEEPFIVLGDSGVVLVDQPSTDSTFIICRPSCANDSKPVQIGSDAWHNDAFYANTLTLYWGGSGQQLVVYANGQEVTAVNFSYSSGTDGLALGAEAQGEALYTHLTVYTPSAT